MAMLSCSTVSATVDIHDDDGFDIGLPSVSFSFYHVVRAKQRFILDPTLAGSSAASVNPAHALKTMASDENNDIKFYHERLNASGTPNYDENDPLKYIVPPCLYRRVPRWPNDGIDAYRKEHYNKKQIKALRGMALHPKQKELTELLAHWPSESSLKDLIDRAEETNDDSDVTYLINRPLVIQSEAALAFQNFEAAKAHLLEAYRSQDPRVRDILEQSGTKSCVHKASRDPSRLPRMEHIIMPLLHNRLASDANLSLLFGAVNHVRGIVLSFGTNIAKPPAPGSRRYAAIQPYLNIATETKIKAAPKVCAMCGATAGKLVRCTGCLSVHYCGKECQTKAWIIHRPDCLKVQGKPVSDSMRAKAETALKAHELAAVNAMKEIVAEQRNAFYLALLNEDPSLVNEKAQDMLGQLQRVHAPYRTYCALEVITRFRAMGLSTEFTGMMASMPLGIDAKKVGVGIGYLYSDTKNDNAKILLLGAILFKPGPTIRLEERVGLHVKGIYVVDRVEEGKGRKALWKPVPEPYMPGFNRYLWLAAYLQAATRFALAVPSDVDLGIHMDKN